MTTNTLQLLLQRQRDQVPKLAAARAGIKGTHAQRLEAILTLAESFEIKARIATEELRASLPDFECGHKSCITASAAATYASLMEGAKRLEHVFASLFDLDLFIEGRSLKDALAEVSGEIGKKVDEAVDEAVKKAAITPEDPRWSSLPKEVQDVIEAINKVPGANVELVTKIDLEPSPTK